MEIKRAIKKIIALGTGATMVGATVLGAMATADLANYPAPFVEDGIWNAVSIIGAKSSSEDNVAITDIVLGLSKVEVGTTAATTATTSLEGDAYQITKSTDALNLYEYLSADSGSGDLQNGPIGTITKNELNALADGSITNAKGTFTYNQYIIMPEDVSVVYEADTDKSDDPAFYLKFSDSKTGYIYRLSFASALKSDIDSAFDFDDLDNKKIKMLGKEFTIINTDNATGVIDLMGGTVPDVLSEGETKTYTVDGIDYTVEVVQITDFSSDNKVKFIVNDEPMEAMMEGETLPIATGVELGVKEIWPNEAGDVGSDTVDFYIGAEKVTITDTAFGTANWGGTLNVGGEDVSNLGVNVVGTFPSSGTDVSISKIEVNWTTSDDYYVPIGGKLSDELESDGKDQLFLQNLNFEFTGVDFGETEEIKVNPSSDYAKLQVPTKTGGDLSFYAFHSGDAGRNVSLGKTSDRPLVISPAAISKNHQFIVSSGKYTHLLEATYFDTANTRVTFKDVGLGTSFKVTATQGGSGTFYLDGYEYSFIADYTGGTANFTSFGSDTEGEIWTPSEAKVKLSTTTASDITSGLIQLYEYHKGPADGSSSNVKHINVSLTDAGTDTTVAHRITCQEPTSSDTSFNLRSWDSNTNYKDGYNRWGTHVEYNFPTSSQSYVTIAYPTSEATANVYIASGVTTTSATAAGEAGVAYTYVDIGSVMRDVEVADWKATNVIVVGGPCVNTVAAELLESDPANCAAGFEEGKAKIKLFEVEDKVALLVAGMSGADTKRAGLVLKNYKDYADDLVGTEVEMTATSDADIALAAPVVPEVEPEVEPEEPVVE